MGRMLARGPGGQILALALLAPCHVASDKPPNLFGPQRPLIMEHGGSTSELEELFSVVSSPPWVWRRLASHLTGCPRAPALLGRASCIAGGITWVSL